ncbi:MAG: metal-dependent hydrolase [Candidatus Thiocaldithrix dubininis]|uniref:Metal-dependent hydrolase n=1 Tax=Candidatus Thiocaldithrix dubininis TaxID=3080823 RepID=A0AA95H6K0_9GAMM|nr:MAG: metal-dependent hydrolase [Candidatus Thiocaldithrix dubininis]
MDVRPLRFPAPDDLPKYWYQNNPVLTHAFNAVLLMFPKGELFFIEAVTAYRKDVSDTTLLKDIQLFTAQEAHHSRAHQLHNDYLKSQGYDIEKIEQDQDRKFKKLKKILTKKQRLAVVVAYEHFTAIFAEVVLNHPEWLKDIHPVYQDFLNWHAVEEIEHKAVAFNVYQYIGGSYLMRVSMMILAFLAFYKSLIGYLNYFAKVDKVSKWQRVKVLSKFIFIKPASFFQLTPGYLHYFSPTFHPNNRHDEALLEQWKKNNEQRVLATYSMRG